MEKQGLTPHGGLDSIFSPMKRDVAVSPEVEAFINKLKDVSAPFIDSFEWCDLNGLGGKEGYVDSDEEEEEEDEEEKRLASIRALVDRWFLLL